MSVHRERELIALAATGRFTAEQCESVPSSAFTSDARLLAWTCAARAARLFGAESSFFGARLMRVKAPRLDLPLDDWRELNHAADAELDEAERLDEERTRQAAARNEGRRP